MMLWMALCNSILAADSTTKVRILTEDFVFDKRLTLLKPFFFKTLSLLLGKDSLQKHYTPN